jgi:flagellar motor switch protein FliN/FliY
MPDSNPTQSDPSITPETMAADALHAAAQAAAEISAQANSANAAQQLDLPDFAGSNGSSASGPSGLGLLDDVTLNVKIELGRTRMYVEDVLRLNENSVVELDKAAGDPVDIYVNDRHVARGEVLVLNENFCVRISEIVQQAVVDS